MFIDTPGQVSIKATPRMPVPKKGEALLKVLYGGICGSSIWGPTAELLPIFRYPEHRAMNSPPRSIEIEPNDKGLEKGMIVLQSILQLYGMLLLPERPGELLHHQPDHGCSERRCLCGIYHNAY